MPFCNYPYKSKITFSLMIIYPDPCLVAINLTHGALKILPNWLRWTRKVSLIGIDIYFQETIKQPPGRPKEPPKEPAWKKEVREAREKKQAGDEKVGHEIKW